MEQLTSHDMRPSLASNHQANGRAIITVDRGHLYESHAALSMVSANRSHYAVGKFGHAVGRAAGLPALGALVGHIEVVVCRYEMLRIHAWWIVASVTDENILRYGSVREFVSHTMRPSILVLKTNPSVAMLIEASDPKPAAISFANKAPEFIGKMLPFVRAIASAFTVQSNTFRDLARVCIKRSITAPASSIRRAIPSSGIFSYGQGVNLRDRFANWLGSFGVCASFEPLSILTLRMV